MKGKIFFILILFCFVSLFTSAGKNNGKCCKYSVCPAKAKTTDQHSSSKSTNKGFDLSPMQFIVFGI